jgi:hypothetical protein
MMRSTVGHVSCGHELCAIQPSTVERPEARTVGSGRVGVVAVAACVATRVGVGGARVATGGGVAVGADASVSALETIVSEDGGVSVGSAVRVAVAVPLAAAVAVDAPPCWPGQAVEDVFRMLRTALIASEEAG